MKRLWILALPALIIIAIIIMIKRQDLSDIL